MDIKPDRKVDSVRLNQIADATDGARVKRFGVEKQPNLSAENKLPGSVTFQTVAANFRKADLKSPTRVNELVSGVVNQLLESELSNLQPSEHQIVGDWMRSDPIIRERILRCFERTPP